MQFIILDTGDAERFAHKLDHSALNAENFEVPLAEIQADIFRIEKIIFSSGGRRGGGSWKQLAESTMKRKVSTRILRDTDALYSSVTEPGAEFQILKITPHHLVFGTERPYAYVHQYGSSTTPRRPFIRFLPTDVDRWARILLNHVMRGFRV